MSVTSTVRRTPRTVLAGLVIVVAAIIGLLATPASAQTAELQPGGSFVDDNDSPHEAEIEAIAAVGITLGCNPPANDRFCPAAPVTRAEMATFLTRALGLGVASVEPFSDITGSVHEADINTIAAAGITQGCNPPTNDAFCPDNLITRAEMASMLTRALGLTKSATGPFNDLFDSVHTADINAIAAAGVTLGCNPPTNDMFCPNQLVTREQMASLLARAVHLDPIEPPDAPFHLIASFTTHHNCCQTRVTYVQEVAKKINGIVMLPGDTLSMLKVLKNDVDSGNCQTSTTLFNAVWYAGLDEIEHRPHSVDFARYPQAVESTLIVGAVDLKFRNDTSHPLEIRAHYTGTSVTVELWGDNDGRTVVGDFTAATGTVLDVVNEGGSNARIVDTDTVASGRTYRVTRTITDAVGSESESWSWTYRY